MSSSDSEAGQNALAEGAAPQRVRSAISDEVSRVAADERDREEMRIILEQLAALTPPPSD